MLGTLPQHYKKYVLKLIVIISLRLIQIQTAFQKIDLTNCDPAFCVRMLTSMDNLKVLAALKQKLKKCGSEWIEGFIDEDGVGRYVNSVGIFVEPITLALNRQFSKPDGWIECGIIDLGTHLKENLQL